VSYLKYRHAIPDGIVHFSGKNLSGLNTPKYANAAIAAQSAARTAIAAAERDRVRTEIIAAANAGKFSTIVLFVGITTPPDPIVTAVVNFFISEAMTAVAVYGDNQASVTIGWA
jgi:hypothetical protein